MGTLGTVAQAKLDRVIQAKISEDAWRRVRIQAAARECTPGQIISNLITDNLPPVDPTLFEATADET